MRKTRIASLVRVEISGVLLYALSFLFLSFWNVFQILCAAFSFPACSMSCVVLVLLHMF